MPPRAVHPSAALASSRTDPGPLWATLLEGWRAGQGSLHQRLSTALQDCIQRGDLGPGDPLPAERTLASLLTVSRSTVVTAYDTLATEDWVTRRQGSGTFVSSQAPRRAEVLALRTPLARPGLSQSSFSPLSSSALGATVQSRGQPPRSDAPQLPTLDLTIAVPTLTLAQRQRLAQISQDALGTAAPLDARYHPLGLPELREALARLYCREGLPTSPEQIIVTSGAQQAISLIASAFVRRGDSVLLETPTYFGAIDVFRAQGAALHGVPVTRQGIEPDTFAAALHATSPRLAFLTPTFQNPTGTVLPVPARAELAEIIRRAGLPTIEDDTLIDLGFEGTPPPRLSSLDPEGSIINVGSLSKLYWAGLRVGWMRLPRPLLAGVAQLKTLSDFGSSLPAQAIALALLNDWNRLRQERRATVTPARDLLVSLLRQQVPDWTFEVPSGGQFLWAELPTAHVTAFTLYAQSYGLRLFPGTSMGVTPLPDRFLRLPFTLPPEQLPEAALRLGRAWASYRERGGTERLA